MGTREAIVMITVNFDGLCYPRNPGGVAAYGFLVRRDGQVLHRGMGVVGQGRGMTNNVAEYEALLAAARWIRENAPHEDVVFQGDSSLVIKQMRGEYQVRSATSRKYVPQVRSILAGMDVSFRWVPRLENQEADQLSREAYNSWNPGRIRV
ncbi:MAG: Ribonuclease HI [Methanosaeta sp. PtaB.Bin039]|nr:MAG: Ribonuclease HI [Methanosaeta sp. PtaB.Bin039]HOT07508.1 ribonuclease HI [Methanotrichaceae archaeon]HQF16106.1 ribonuclease HI [Methanotrichaceae archaeon]HQI90780.1 ribonuclease HI [Methanotrichaceae archaeon]HQJ28264.1 ribonuclease HI [Methanotrichaceae archaeon]